MKTRTVHLRPRDRRTVREFDSTDAIPRGQFGLIAGQLYVRTPVGDLLEVTAALPAE